MRNATGRRRVRFVLLVMVAALTIRGAEGQAPWPLATAPHIIHLAKVAGLEDRGGLPDSQWLHLHRGHGAVTDGLHDVSLEVEGPRRLDTSRRRWRRFVGIRNCAARGSRGGIQVSRRAAECESLWPWPAATRITDEVSLGSLACRPGRHTTKGTVMTLLGLEVTFLLVAALLAGVLVAMAVPGRR